MRNDSHNTFDHVARTLARFLKVPFDQEMNFRDFLFRKLQPPSRARKCLQAPRNVILDGHAFANVMQQQRQDQ